MMARRYSHTTLIRVASSLLERSGLDPIAAETMSKILVEADLMGHTTHGLSLLPAYIDELSTGRMKRRGEPVVLSDHGSAVVWDGEYLSGILLTDRAVHEALERSDEYPVVTYAIRRAHHIACLAAYMPAITDRDRLGILAASDPNARMVAPFGARMPLYSPNPIAAGIPAGSEGPIIIDLSTSVVAAGVVNEHKTSGTPLPGKWLLDADGEPTDDPSALSISGRGSILPLGGMDVGYKGYALALLIEAITSGLAGFGRAEQPSKWGASVFLQIINPASFSGFEEFRREMRWLANACRESEPRAGYRQVRVPGDRALALRREQLERGVLISDDVMNRVRDRCRSAGIAVPKG